MNALIVLMSLFTLINAQITSTNPDQFTKLLVLKGISSTFAVEIYGLPSPESPVIEPVRHSFRHLADVWTSSVRVLCKITFDDLGRAESLASGGGVLFVRFDRSPDRELLPIAAAEAITSRDLNAQEKGADKYDVLIKINTRTPWHVDLSRKPSSSRYDLATVLLHEAYHNLLFSGAISVDMHRESYPSAKLLDGYPARFDLFLANERGCSVLDYARDTRLANSTKRTTAHLLAQAVTNGRLFFHDQTSGLHIPLYAPLHYQSKSSIYHVDTARGATAALMNRYIPTGFMQRHVNDEIRSMQRAFLNPDNRGAKRCRLPLLDPKPGKDAEDPYAYGPRSNSGVFNMPVWAIVVCCAVAAVTSIAIFLSCASRYGTKRSTKGKPAPVRRDGTATELDLWPDKRLSSTSSELLMIDDGVSCEKIEIDVRDLEIDEADFHLFEHRGERYSH